MRVRTRSRRRAPVLAALVVTAAGGLAACGSTEEAGPSTPQASASAPAPAQQPPDAGPTYGDGAGRFGSIPPNDAVPTAGPTAGQNPGYPPPGQQNPDNQNPGDQTGTDQQEQADDGWSLWTILLAAALVLAIAAGAVLLRPRPTRRPVTRPAPTTVRVAAPRPPQAHAQDLADPFPVDAEPAPSGEPLRSTLRRVGDLAPSGAIAEQIRRLLDGGAGREDLIGACIHYRDQLHERDPALAAEIVRGLAADGVTEIGADGEVFDPTRHDAIGNVPTDSPGLHDMIAETVRPGFRDGLRVIRPPEVVVYRHAHEPAGQDQ